MSTSCAHDFVFRLTKRTWCQTHHFCNKPNRTLVIKKNEPKKSCPKSCSSPWLLLMLPSLNLVRWHWATHLVKHGYVPSRDLCAIAIQPKSKLLYYLLLSISVSYKNVISLMCYRKGLNKTPMYLHVRYNNTICDTKATFRLYQISDLVLHFKLVCHITLLEWSA